MARLVTILHRIRRLGFRKLLFLLAAFAIFLLAFFMLSLKALDYSESTSFCTSCHNVMDAEIAMHSISPHANTDCGTCHIGPGVIPRMSDKVYGARYLVILPLDLFNRPLETPLDRLRPAREICEQCHWPDKFYPVRVVTKNEYDTDFDNTLERIVLPLKTGSGQTPLTDQRGRGIHWHIQNPVRYIATDDQRQEIPWVQTEIDGELATYTSLDSTLTDEEIAAAEVRTMDCIDCHNRVTHLVTRPSDAIDEALAQGRIADDLPYIKQQGVEVLETRYDTRDEAMQAIDGVVDYYSEEFPDVYAARFDDIEQAVQEFKAIYENTHFPFMNVYWDTYHNNVGHKYAAGCFRCHDSEHLNEDGEAIRPTCSLCHGVPLVAGPDDALPKVSLEVAEEPESHQNTLWLAEHRFAFDDSCSDCHTTTNPAGTDNTSFCSNSACHGSGWDYLAIDTPQIIERVAPPHLLSDDSATGAPQSIPHRVSVDMVCTNCHGLDHVLPYPENHTVLNSVNCDTCHISPELAASVQPSPSTVASDLPPIPTIPHELAGLEGCIQCHGTGTSFPYPSNHIGVTQDQCTACHQVVVAPQSDQAAQPPETGAPAATGGNLIAPLIPHELEQRQNCLLCHAPNAGAFAVPANHVGRGNDTCQVCHVLSAEN